MRIWFCGMIAAGMLVGALTASGAVAVQKKSPSKTAPKRKATARKRSGPVSHTTAKSRASAPVRHTRTSAKRGAKKPAVRATTWRNRQTAPTADRYREIQEAMVAKGYLKSDQVSGQWDQNSMDALKRFQAAQNIDASGKIDSLSLIALGLGPKRDTASTVKPPTNPAQPSQ